MILIYLIWNVMSFNKRLVRGGIKLFKQDIVLLEIVTKYPPWHSLRTMYSRQLENQMIIFWKIYFLVYFKLFFIHVNPAHSCRWFDPLFCLCFDPGPFIWPLIWLAIWPVIWPWTRYLTSVICPVLSSHLLYTASSQHLTTPGLHINSLSRRKFCNTQ